MNIVIKLNSNHFHTIIILKISHNSITNTIISILRSKYNMPINCYFKPYPLSKSQFNLRFRFLYIKNIAASKLIRFQPFIFNCVLIASRYYNLIDTVRIYVVTCQQQQWIEMQYVILHEINSY